MTNRKLGNEFEREFCEILRSNGMWVHNFAQSQVGQPMDVIAVKGGIPYLVDCKVCSQDYFVTSRIEENQRGAIEVWRMAGNGDGFFAVKFLSCDATYMLPYGLIETLDTSRITLEQCRECAPTLTEWMVDNEICIRTSGDTYS